VAQAAVELKLERAVQALVGRVMLADQVLAIQAVAAVGQVR
jgi:hypothetical protein